MNYIILNGTPSTNITGLLIQTLPPISLPLIRTKVETVDGMDGDIVTKLGYGAYDKQFSIGLYGNYNIDDVVGYFASSGDVVFSNEPDKVYKYQNLEQIDFERLIRFKTALVTFHVQPFKMALNEIPVESTSSSMVVHNSGNTVAKPTLTIVGSGTVSVYHDTREVFIIDMGEEEQTIIINVEDMNAYDDSGNFKNRSVTGDYSGLVLPVGDNTISWSGGSVSSVTCQNYSRWL